MQRRLVRPSGDESQRSDQQLPKAIKPPPLRPSNRPISHPHYHSNSPAPSRPRPTKVPGYDRDPFGLNKSQPAIQRPEQERLVEESITLKKENNTVKAENLKIRTKVLQLEREIARRDEELAELRSKAGEKHYYVALQQAHIVAGLKQTVKELRVEIKTRAEAEESLKKSLKFTQIAELMDEIALYEDECIRLKQLISGPREPSSLDLAQKQLISQLTSDKSALEQRVQTLQEKVTKLEMRLKAGENSTFEDSKPQEFAAQQSFRIANLEGDLALARKECEKQREIAQELSAKLTILQGKETETALQFLVNKLASKDLSFQEVLAACGEGDTVASLQSKVEALRVTVPLRYWEALQARYATHDRLDLGSLRRDVGQIRAKVRDTTMAFFRLEQTGYSQNRSKIAQISSKADESRAIEESQDGEYEDDYDPPTEEKPYPPSDEPFEEKSRSDRVDYAVPSEEPIFTAEEPSSGPSEPSHRDSSKRHNSSEEQLSRVEAMSSEEQLEKQESTEKETSAQGIYDAPAERVQTPQPELPPYIESSDPAPDSDSVLDRGSVYFPAVEGRIKAEFTAEIVPDQSLFPRPPTPVFPHSPTPDPVQYPPLEADWKVSSSPSRSDAFHVPSPEPIQTFFPPTPEPEETIAPPAHVPAEETSHGGFSDEHSERYFEPIPLSQPYTNSAEPQIDTFPEEIASPAPIPIDSSKQVPSQDPLPEPEKPRPGRLPPLSLPKSSEPPVEEVLSPIRSARPQVQQEVLSSHSHPFLPPADSESNSSIFDDQKEVDIDTISQVMQANMKGSRSPAGVLQTHLEEVTSDKDPEDAIHALEVCLQEPPFLLEPVMSDRLADWLWTQARGQSWMIPDLLGQQIGGWEQYESITESQPEDLEAKTKANVQTIAQAMLDTNMSVREAFDCEGEEIGQADFLYGLRTLGLGDMPPEEFQLLVLSLAISEGGDMQVEDLERLFALYGVPIRPRELTIISHSPTPVPVDDISNPSPSSHVPSNSFPLASIPPLPLPPTLLFSEPSQPHFPPSQPQFPQPPASSHSHESGLLSPLSESARVVSARSGASVVEQQGSGLMSPVSEFKPEDVIADTPGVEESGGSEYEYMGERVSSSPLGNSA